MRTHTQLKGFFAKLLISLTVLMGLVQRTGAGQRSGQPSVVPVIPADAMGPSAPGCGLDQGHRDLLWRLEHFPELSFGDPDGALIGGHAKVVGARNRRKLPCDEQRNCCVQRHNFAAGIVV
jgi:hypothetical protein